MEVEGKVVDDNQIKRQLATARISDELWSKTRVHKLNPFAILDAIRKHGLIVGDILQIILAGTEAKANE